MATTNSNHGLRFLPKNTYFNPRGKILNSICSRQARNDATSPNSSRFSSFSCLNQQRYSQTLITKFYNSNVNTTTVIDSVSSNTSNITATSGIDCTSSSLLSTDVNEVRVTMQPITDNVSRVSQSHNLLPSLPIYYNNVRSITNKKNVCMKIEMSVYKVLCLTETWLNDSHSNGSYFPTKFTVYRCDRSTQMLRRSGGVAILVHHTLNHKSVKFPFAVDPQSEFLAIEIVIKPQPLIVYVCYLSVFNLDIALTHLQRVKFLNETYRHHKIIIFGDFNLYDIKWSADSDFEGVFLPHTTVDSSVNQVRSYYNSSALEFLQKMMSLPMSQLSNYSNSASNVLDLVFVNKPEEFKLKKDHYSIIDQSQQDAYHIPYEVTVEYCINSTINTEALSVYSYTRGNYARICTQIDAINFQHEFSIRDIDTAYKYFHQIMHTIIDQNVPKRKVKKFANKPKWWSSQLQRLKNRRDKLFKRKSTADVVAVEYERVLNEFNELADRRYSDYISSIQREMKSNPKEFWNFVNINKSSDSYPNEMRLNDRISKTKKETVDLFAEYFESIYVPDETSWDFDEIYSPLSDAEEINVSLFDIEGAIDSLKWKSGSGPDSLSPFVIKMCSSSIVWPIWLLFQKSFTFGKIADALKVSRIVPVYKKKGDKCDVKNYRVIAIQSLVMKIHEIAVKRKLSEKIQPLLSNAQHGFRNKRSVVTNLLNLSILAHKAFQYSSQLDVFYGDYKTAFDTVWISKLIGKCARYRIGKQTAKWLCEFLTGRVNFVQIDMVTSRTYKSPSGVPPGSSLGPLLFSIFIDDIVEVVKEAAVLLFADDIKLAMLIHDYSDTRKMQQDIDNVITWGRNNRLYFNKGKCYIFSAYRSDTNYIKVDYAMGDHIIELVDEIRDLGILIDRRFYFGHHIEQLTIKCRQIIGCIKHYSNGNFTLETLRVLYMAYVRSRLEYASVIWNPISNVYKDDIESIQKQFVIYLLDSRRNATSFRLAPYKDRCSQLKLQSLELRRTVADAVLAFDIYVNNIRDELISSNFVRYNGAYELRDTTSNLLILPRFSYNYLTNQPIVRLIKLINE